MHYKNGREAKNGDKVVLIPEWGTLVAGILNDAVARATLREIFNEIERRAEANMMRTGKLEGMHYAALKDVRRELNA